MSGSDGMHTGSSISSARNEATTRSSACITRSGGKLPIALPAISWKSVAITPGINACTRTPVPSASVCRVRVKASA